MLEAVVGTRFLVCYADYDGERETVAAADINCEEAWLLYEYSPYFVPPPPPEREDAGTDAPLSSNAEWREQRRAARDALEHGGGGGGGA
eukprot:SAG11_NODE_12690_length_690_cov_1.456853_1_plen_88_part_10